MIKRSVILAVLSMALLSTLRLSAQGLEGKIVELQATQISREFNKQYGYRFKIGDQSTPLASVDNMTTNVIRAVKTHGLVVILGSIGAEANLITILDAKSRQECAELMCYSPQLSPNDQYVAFRRFFPHLTKPELVNDTIAILRLPSASKGRETACETTAVHGAPPIDLGTDILNLRGGSSFLAPIIWNEAGDSFNFLAGTVGNGFIVGRAGLIDGQWKVTKSLPQEINGSAAKPINAVVSGFTQDDSGVLVVHVAETNDPTRGTIQMEMLFDALTLSPLKERGR